jgi:hypothetical protein
MRPVDPAILNLVQGHREKAAPSHSRSGARDAYAVSEVNGGLGCAVLPVSGDGERSVWARCFSFGQGAVPAYAMRRGKTTSVIKGQKTNQATERGLAVGT